LNARLAALSRKRRCRLQRTFFGLNDKYIENVYEQFFLLKYYGGWSFFEAYNLPVKIRLWFMMRLAKQLEKEQEQAEAASSKAKSRSR
jgi:hypothetical protein